MGEIRCQVDATDESGAMASIKKNADFEPKNPKVKTVSREKIALVAAILDFSEDLEENF